MVAKFKIRCGRCGQSIRVPEKLRGTSIECPSCHHEIPAGEADDGMRSTHHEVASDAEDTVADRTTALVASSVVLPRFIGRFEVRRELGEGGFGKVYEAFDPQLGRLVALKVPVFSSTNLLRVRRFITEARSAARLHHPNIVAVYESCQSDSSQLYIASEFVDGMTLREWLRTEEISLSEKVQWIRDLARALSYAHSEGVIHRDIKPENILVDRVNRRPKIVDFGLAKVLDDSEDASSPQKTQDSVLGTPAFMSPEQARGELSKVGAHSDQYSLGAVLYQALTGTPPFTGSPYLIIAAVAGNQEPDPVGNHAPGTPVDLIAICEKAMAKDSSERYRDCSALADDLDCWLDNRPVTARPINWMSRLYRWCRRNPAIAWLTSLMFFVLSFSTITLTVGLVRLQHEKERADNHLRDVEKQKELVDIERQKADQRAEQERSAQLKEAEARQQAEKLVEERNEVIRQLNATNLELTASKELVSNTEKARAEARAEVDVRLQIEKELRMAGLLQEANAYYVRGEGLLQSSPTVGVLWMARGLEKIRRSDSQNEPLDALSSLIYRKVIQELERFPDQKHSITVAKTLDRPEHVRFSGDGRAVATFSGRLLQVHSTTTYQEQYRHQFRGSYLRDANNGLGNPDLNGFCFLSDGLSLVCGSGHAYLSPPVNAGGLPLPRSSHSGVFSLSPGDSGEAQIRVLWETGSMESVAWFSPEYVRDSLVVFGRSPKGSDVAKSGETQRLLVLSGQNSAGGQIPLDSVVPVRSIEIGLRSGELFLTTDHTIRRFSVPQMQTIPVLQENDSRILSLKLSNDESRFALALSNGNVRVYNSADLQFVSLPHDGVEVRGLAFSPDARVIATSTSDGLVRLWSTLTGALIGLPLVHTDAVRALAFEGSDLLTVDAGGTLRRWGLPQPSARRVLSEANLIAARFTDDDRFLLFSTNTRGQSGSLSLYDVPSGGEIKSVAVRNPVIQAEFLKGDEFLVAATDSSIQLCRLPDLSLEAELMLYPVGVSSKDGRITQVTFAKQSGMGACVTKDGKLYRWAFSPDKTVRQIECPPTTTVAVSPDETSFFVGFSSGVLRKLSLAGRIDEQVFYQTTDGAAITALRFVGAQGKLAVGTERGTVILIDVTAPNATPQTVVAGGEPSCISFDLTICPLCESRRDSPTLRRLTGGYHPWGILVQPSLRTQPIFDVMSAENGRPDCSRF